MNGGGTFSVGRSVWDHPAFKREPFSEREAFLWLVSEASWKPRTRRIGNKEVSLDRGQLCASVRFMAERWQWSKSRVSRVLKRWKNRDMLDYASGTDALVITVCDYDEYQPEGRPSGTATGQYAGQQRDSSGTNEKKGEIRRKESGGGGPARAREVDPQVEDLLEAAKVDMAKRPLDGWLDFHALAAIQRWTATGLEFVEAVQVVRAVMGSRPDPPATPAYFDKAIARAAERKRTADRPIPLEEYRNDADRPTAADRRERRARAEVDADLEWARSLDRPAVRGGGDAP